MDEPKRTIISWKCCANCKWSAQTATELGTITECLNGVIYIDDPCSDKCEHHEDKYPDGSYLLGGLL